MSKLKLVLYIAVGVLACGGVFAVGWAVKSCQADRDHQKTMETIRDLEAEHANTLKTVTQSYKDVQAAKDLSMKEYKASVQNLEALHADIIASIDSKLDERFTKIQNWYEAELSRRRMELKNEISKISDNPVDVGHMFLDLFGPGPGDGDSPTP